MDPATAIGVSSAVLTFVDVGAKVVRGAIHIYGATNSDTEWENPRDVAAKMHLLARRLRVPTTRDLTMDEEELCELAGQCQALSQELAELFKSILPNNSKSKRQCLWAATKLKLRDDQVSGLEKRLESCREQFELHLTYANYLTGTDMKASLEQLLSQQDNTSRKLVQAVEELKQGLKRIEREENSPLNPEALAQIQSAVQIQSETIDAAVASRILAGLSFSSMHSRYDGIEDAHASTFRWFFDDDSDAEDSNAENSDKEAFEPAGSNQTDSSVAQIFLDEAKTEAKDLFNDWLSQPQNGILHISGKLGSGKSTLMKFLVDHSRTRKSLQAWAGNNTLVFASFFFWKAGLAEQRSLPGLLRTLLHDSLRSDPTLIPLLLPEIWTSAKKNWLAQTPVNLTDREIKETLARIISFPATVTGRRFCFFIDGLDEYEEKPQMDHTDMVNMLNRWSDSGAGQVKICVSSREDNVFMNAFRADRRIRIHDLTRADMHAFVSSRLLGIIPAENTTDDTDFTLQIIDKAQGIFLWVALVVKEVRRRHENQDISNMSKFLEYLPVDLEDLFRYIICELIHPEDRPMAHRTFFMALNAHSHNAPYTLWEHSFINDYVENSEFPIEHPKEPIDDQDFAVQNLEHAASRMRAWCRGLLEAGPAHTDERGSLVKGSYRIDFSHRSIPEFLSTGEMKAEGQNWTANINWIDAFSKMYLASCQSFSAFRILPDLTIWTLQRRAYLGMDLEPPFTYLSALERCYQRRYDASRLQVMDRHARISCEANCWHVTNWPETAPDFQKEGPKFLIEMPPMPSILLALLDGDHPYPCWRLSHDRDIADDGVFVTFMWAASIGSLRTLPLQQGPPSDNYPPRRSTRIQYRLLDLLADSGNLSSQLLPGFALQLGFPHMAAGQYLKRALLYHSETVGVLGQYLMAWFLQSCFWHPSLWCAKTPMPIEDLKLWDMYSAYQQAVMVEQFGGVLERLFRMDQGRFRFEAHATLGLLPHDRACMQITFVIGDLVQKPKWVFQKSFDDKVNLSREDYVSVSEVAYRQTWTLEELIITMNPPNRDTLLRMISERNSAISGLSALRLDDRGTSEDT